MDKESNKCILKTYKFLKIKLNFNCIWHQLAINKILDPQ